jgi:ABC-type branched-subunit amino acid transport system substrate-binding protein
MQKLRPSWFQTTAMAFQVNWKPKNQPEGDGDSFVATCQAAWHFSDDSGKRLATAWQSWLVWN